MLLPVLEKKIINYPAKALLANISGEARKRLLRNSHLAQCSADALTGDTSSTAVYDAFAVQCHNMFMVAFTAELSATVRGCNIWESKRG